MREIKFRGKRKDNGEWVYGYYCQISGRGFILIDNKSLLAIHIQPRALNSVLVADTVFSHKDCSCIFIEVDPETVGQYTGPEDKNNTEGWDGMIVKAKHKRTGEEMVGPIVWHDQNFAWGVQLKEWIMPLDILINHFDFEFVGNIHDNHELLEDRK